MPKFETISMILGAMVFAVFTTLSVVATPPVVMAHTAHHGHVIVLPTVHIVGRVPTTIAAR